MKQTLQTDKGENTPPSLTPGLRHTSVPAASSCDAVVVWSHRLSLYGLHQPEQIVLQLDCDKMIWILDYMDIATIYPIFLELFFFLSGWYGNSTLPFAQCFGVVDACSSYWVWPGCACPGWRLGMHRWTLRVQWASSARIYWYAYICIADLI